MKINLHIECESMDELARVMSTGLLPGSAVSIQATASEKELKQVQTETPEEVAPPKKKVAKETKPKKEKIMDEELLPVPGSKKAKADPFDFTDEEEETPESDDDEENDTPENSNLSLNDLRTAANALADVGRAEEVKDLVKKYGYKSLAQVDPSEFSAFLKDLTKLKGKK